MEGTPKVVRQSGIPRPVSRLPLPTSIVTKSNRPSPSRERLQADPGLDARRLRRPSYESLIRRPSSGCSSTAKSRTETPIQEETAGYAPITDTRDDVGSVGDEVETRGRTRPSLSERTAETIANIPPSPVSARAQSRFFNGTSPARSPSRPQSTMSSYSRSPSRSSSSLANHNDLLSQPVSKLRIPSRPRISVSGIRTNGATPDVESSSRLRKPSSRQSLEPVSDSAALNKTDIAPKSSALRSSPSVSSLKSIKTNMGPPARPLNVRKARNTQTESSKSRSPSTTSRYVSSTSTIQDELTQEQQVESEARKVSKSSSTLRDTIAKAKAARKAAAAAAAGKEEAAPQTNTQTQANNVNPVTDVDVSDPWGGIDEDPFNQLPKGSNTNVIRNRVASARASGTLNIAAMSLTEIPKEVLTMYEYDPDGAASWFENVDLVKFIAADNELADVSDNIFPDIDVETFDPESDERGPQFSGLEALDLHGNILQSLPVGLRRLHNLRSLNLSNNALTIDKIDLIMEIASLVDLKLANNKLEGSFPASMSLLSRLDSLDLRGNALTKLPEELGELTCLKTLDVSDNQLTFIPFEALSRVPLVTLNASKNKLSGILIPESVDCLETLQSLNVANNKVEVLAANDALALPQLHSLFINTNCIKSLPSLASWQSLLVLLAQHNKLADLPTGFVELKNIKTVDFSGNDITRLDEKIGFMESLTLFQIATNPLRERRLLNMDTEDIKRDMRNRVEPAHDTDDEGSVATQFTLAPETPVQDGWKINFGGVLDRSYSEMTDLETDKLELINAQEIRSLYLQHNALRFFPIPALGMLAQGLIELDLSHNPLNTSELISSSLELPKLQTLNLSSCGLTSLEPLMTNLQAPSLNFLDVSNNRLTGSLAHIRQAYPDVKHVLASDNKIASLDFEAVQGLQVLDISNNDVSQLPPKIGLLAHDRDPRNWGTGSALRRFEVAGNRFRVPRWQTVAKGTDAILEFLREHIRVEDLPEWEHEDDISL
ncbi:Leucine-rich repeat typical subtype [Penicillium taxi]|uniref:Leucine-rich repeat typical subtype n=1 Tax=Penicillium taxi TaxID=168475 RepID=UPI0025453FAB|nr:Leucine-rich repeat typical subtype [Penicillium taxi]KAJ5895408.1 Leucine-rich repeat typical subtype [Penicillium taxi]